MAQENSSTSVTVHGNVNAGGDIVGSIGQKIDLRDSVIHNLSLVIEDRTGTVVQAFTKKLSNEDSDEDSKSSEWTKLSEKITMYKVKPLRKGTSVYLGLQNIGGHTREIAIKLLQESDECNKEVAILITLTHPNIVQIIDSDIYKWPITQRYIAMELCRQTLQEFIDETEFSLPKALSFFKQTILAIVYIHDQHVIHRDLKPTNILVSMDLETVKVSDFGISRELPADKSVATNTRPTAGTEGFKAPEIYNKSDKIGFKSDIFSLAIVGYYTFTHGKHPFGSVSSDLPYNIRNNTNFNLSDLPDILDPVSKKTDQLRHLFECMLKPSPSDRPTAKQVQKDVFFQGVEEIHPQHSEANKHSLSKNVTDTTPSQDTIPKSVTNGQPSGEPGTNTATFQQTTPKYVIACQPSREPGTPAEPTQKPEEGSPPSDQPLEIWSGFKKLRDLEDQREQALRNNNKEEMTRLNQEFDLLDIERMKVAPRESAPARRHRLTPDEKQRLLEEMKKNFNRV